MKQYGHYYSRAIAGAITLASALVVSACSDTSEHASETSANNDALPNSTTTLEMALPQALARNLSENIPGLYALATFNDGEQLCFESDPNSPSSFDAGQQSVINVARGETLTIDIRWFEALGGQANCDPEGLLLAFYAETTPPITNDSTINLEIDQYQIDGDDRLDPDGDGAANLAERNAGTDPFVKDNTQITPDVRIRWVNPGEAPEIDGLYDPIYSARAQFRDDRGELLAIDNLMVDDGAIRSDENTEFRWFAMHDDTWLYIFVLGENVSIANPVRDSTDIYQDDSIDIFIDADNSNGDTYDGVNDRHIIIPLLTSAEDQSSNTTVFEAGPNSASIPDFDFASCLCTTDQHTWEVRLPLEDFDIQADTQFGLEVQINLDNDGGARDEKWGWYHPSRINANTDNTFFNPSFMGTAVLN